MNDLLEIPFGVLVSKTNEAEHMANLFSVCM